MALGKQAKVLTKAQIDTLLLNVVNGRNPVRNRLIVFLSVKAGLRAKEIAHLTWSMVLNSDGTLSKEINLQDCASKGKSGRVIPMAKELFVELGKWQSSCNAIDHHSRIISTERSPSTSAQAIVNMFAEWYRSLGFIGASSHSGRRSAITQWARKITTVGGSLRDVQILAGHSALGTTQRYIESSQDAKRRVVDLV